MNEVADWVNFAPVPYEVNGIGVSVSGGKQIAVDPDQLDNSSEKIRSGQGRVTDFFTHVSLAAAAYQEIYSELGPYLDFSYYSLRWQFETVLQTTRSVSEQMNNVVIALQESSRSYRAVEEQVNGSFGYFSTTGSRVSDNDCDLHFNGQITCPAFFPLLQAGPSGVSSPGVWANSASQMIAALQKVPTDSQLGRIRIQKHITNGKISWSVYVPGTQNWGINTKTPQDFSSDLQTNSGRVSDLTMLVAASLLKSGYRKGQPVELIGHSLGGAASYQFVTNRKLAKQFNVRSVLTLGSNLGSAVPVRKARVLALENENDLVPKLDLSANVSAPNLTTVRGKHPDDKKMGILDSKRVDFRTYLKRHDRVRYQNLARALEKSGDSSYENWARERQRNLGINGQTKTTERDFLLTRK